MTKYRNKFRVESTRLRDWDYASPGWYFVTICARGTAAVEDPHDRDHVETRHVASLPTSLPFGEIVNGEMCLSPIGEIAKTFWLEIPDHHPHVCLDESVVMPNHIHGIVIIEHRPDAVETRQVAPPRKSQPRNRGNTFGPLKPGSLQAIVHSYKAAVTRWCNTNGYTSFKWQSRFHEHIIRNQESLRRIREYCANNPRKWQEDRVNPDNARW